MGEVIQILGYWLLSPEKAEFGSKNPDLLAEDFKFIFPIVGPLTKIEFCTIFGGFKLGEAFPDTRRNYFGFTVDPMEPNRVWFFARFIFSLVSLKFIHSEKAKIFKKTKHPHLIWQTMYLLFHIKECKVTLL